MLVSETICMSDDVPLFAEARGERHRESDVEEADDLQVQQVRERLSAEHVPQKASEARVWRGTEATVSNLWEKIYAQIQIDPSLDFLQKKTRMLRNDMNRIG